MFFVNSVKIDDDGEIVDFEKNYENETFYFTFQAFGHSPSSVDVIWVRVLLNDVSWEATFIQITRARTIRTRKKLSFGADY